MTDHNDAPEEHVPEGGIPTAMDSAEGTVTIEAAEVEEAIEAIQPGEPLPVGANDPEVVAEQPPKDPPGMPKVPDEVDRTIAVAAQHEVDNWQERRNRQHVRLDQATVIDAREGSIHPGTAYDTRSALLAQIQTHAERERKAAQAWSRAVAEQQEQREVFLHAVGARESAEEALFVLGLDKAEDHPTTEPDADEEPPRIPDDVIV